MLTLLKSRHAVAAGALIGLLATTGCGGGGVGAGGVDSPVTGLDPDGTTAAVFGPAFDALRLALDTSRFIATDVPRLIASGADESDSLIALPGRGSPFVLKWLDTDEDGALSTGDALRFDAIVPGTGTHARTGRGLHVAELTIHPDGFASPALYADLAPAASDSTGVALTGSLALGYSRGPIGERLTLGSGAGGFRRSGGGHDALLDSLDLILEIQPYSRAWTLRGGAAVADTRGSLLTVEVTRTLRGQLGADGRPGEIASGAFTVRRADGGLVSGLVTAPGQVRLRSDANNDGLFEESVTAGWAALAGGGR